MKIHAINYPDIEVSKVRQRCEFDAQAIADLAASIAQNGLISPVVVRWTPDGPRLVAGERRLRALEYLWNLGETLYCGNTPFKENEVPCIYLNEMDDIDAFEMELDENIRREDLTWQERSRATSQLYELRRLQADKKGLPPPTVQEVNNEIRAPASANITRQEILVSRHLEDPDVAKAASVKDAFKILQRKEASRKNEELGIEIGKTFSASDHSLYHANCVEWLQTCPPETFNIILTDPPYGIDAQDFNDSGGKAVEGGHAYDDSLESWTVLMESLRGPLFRCAKPDAHLYTFCDIDNFVALKEILYSSGWNVFRTPIIWINPGALRAPWPEHGPWRKYQICLYARKGDRRVTKLFPDYLTASSDPNLGHSAQKPVAVYQDLLSRSARPGDRVLDPFAGSGTIFPACHSMKCRATGIERDPAYYGLALKRLQELK